MGLIDQLKDSLQDRLMRELAGEGIAADVMRRLGKVRDAALPPPPPPPRPLVAARHVFRWDLDKTYLRTEFDSVRDLVKSAIETAADKKAYPGATSLLR